MDSSSFFGILTFSYSSTICENAVLSSLYCLCTFAEKKVIHIYVWVSVWILYIVSFIYLSVFILVPCSIE